MRELDNVPRGLIMKNEKSQPKGETVLFKYIFPSDLKELHVNGAFGGVAPDGMIHMAFYSERQAIPNVEKRPVNPDQTLGDQKEEEKKYQYVRIVQASLVFNDKTATNFINWLDGRIKDLEQLREQIAKIAAKKGEK
jgi:hypothetical protein